MNKPGRTFTRAVLVLGGVGYFLLLVIALLVLHLSPDVVMALTFGGIALVVVALRPYVGVHAFVFLLFFEYVFEAREGLTPMKVLGAIILGGWLLSLMTRRGSALRMSPPALFMIAFVAWNAVCLAYAIELGAAVSRVFSFTQLGMAALMFASVVNTPYRLRGVWAAFVLWALVSTVIAIAQYYAGQTPMAIGLVGNRNLLAVYIAIAIACAYVLYQVTRTGLPRLALLATLPVLFLGLALTFSRGGLITTVVVLLLVSWRVVQRRNVLVLLGSAAMLCLMTFIFPSEFFERARSIVPTIQRQEDTWGARVRLWRVAGRMVKDRPIVGVGPGNFTPAYHRYARGGEMLTRKNATHNTYVGTVAESGIPGLTLFLLTCIFSILEARRTIRAARKAGRSDIQILAVAVEVNLFAIMIAGLSANTEALKVWWMTIGLAIGLRHLRSAGVPIRAPAPDSQQRPVDPDEVLPRAGTATA